MADNFEFLDKIDSKLYSDIKEAQKLFCDEYFNQSMVQLRIFAENMSKNILNSSDNLTFDDTLSTLKDKAKTDRQKEFLEDMYSIKQIGNKCAHGEDIEASEALGAIRCAFEAAINYYYFKKGPTKVDKLRFDDTLLITGKKLEENTLVKKYVEAAQKELDEKYENEEEQIEEAEEQKPKRRKKEVDIKKIELKNKVKQKVKEAKKNLKNTINKPDKQKKDKPKKEKKTKKKSNFLKHIIFIAFCILSLFLLTKLIFFF